MKFGRSNSQTKKRRKGSVRKRAATDEVGNIERLVKISTTDQEVCSEPPNKKCRVDKESINTSPVVVLRSEPCLPGGVTSPLFSAEIEFIMESVVAAIEGGDGEGRVEGEEGPGKEDEGRGAGDEGRGVKAEGRGAGDEGRGVKAEGREEVYEGRGEGGEGHGEGEEGTEEVDEGRGEAGPEESRIANERVLANRKSQLVLGVNSVTRLLEQGRLEAGLLCSSSPAILLQHLLPLAAMHKVPFAALPNMSKSISQCLGIKTATCIGIKKLSDGGNYFSDLCNTISHLAGPITAPWLHTPASNQPKKSSSFPSDENHDNLVGVVYHLLEVKRVKTLPNGKRINKKRK